MKDRFLPIGSLILIVSALVFGWVTARTGFAVFFVSSICGNVCDQAAPWIAFGGLLFVGGLLIALLVLVAAFCGFAPKWFVATFTIVTALTVGGAKLYLGWIW